MAATLEPQVTHDFFPSLEGYGEHVIQDNITKGRTRVFVLEKSSQYLPVPHCLQVDRVQVGVRIQDEFKTWKVRRSAVVGDVETQTTRGYTLRYATDDTTPLLVRSLKCNHGLWQANVPIRVSGEWDWGAIKADADLEATKTHHSAINDDVTVSTTAQLKPVRIPKQ